jgi:hypothetical protein
MTSLRTLSMVSLTLALLLPWPLEVPAAEVPDAARRQEIETVVREYLRAHPEVVMEALQEMERRDQEAQQKQRIETIRAVTASVRRPR